MESLTQKEIIERIVQIRKRAGHSQADIARALGLKSATYSMIERGKSKLTIPYLKIIAEFLDVSVYQLLLGEQTMRTYSNQRISKPQQDDEKIAIIAHYMLERCAYLPHVNLNFLYKLMYLADFNYYQIYEEQLSSAQYKKLNHVPVPQKLDTIMKHMLTKKIIKRIKIDDGDYPMIRYIPLNGVDLRKILASEKQVMDQVFDRYARWANKTLGQFIQNDLPWQATMEGEVIDYESVFYRPLPYSVREDEVIQRSL